MSTILYILLALLLLGIMVTVHELGHFCAARACGIAVRAFSIGFGPKILGWKSKKHETEYTLRLIPGGGYCAFYGEDDTEGKEAKEDPRSMTLQPAWKRLITIFAGPLMNFVLAFLVGLVFFFGYGLPYAGDEVTMAVLSVNKGSPAEAAGFLADDVIVALDGEAVGEDFIERIIGWDGGAPLAVTVRRGEETRELSVTPEYNSNEGRYMIGATLQPCADTVWVHKGFGETVSHTWNVCISAGGAILEALKNLVTRGEGIDQMSGPVGVIRVIADETREYKLMGYLNVLMVISINLGLVNLLPIPGLDGCRILFVLFEMIFRRPINRRVEAYIHLAGYIFLIGLMLLFTFRDVLNIFG
ncbi:MAG: site-2 protease family protein [Clostridia bacterium]|nr:site-2 protease family protein [Clostridia bacterium]